MEIEEVGWGYWKHEFKQHHYMSDAGVMAFATAYVAFTPEGEPVAHLGVSGKTIGHGRREARACRMVVKPEWQGAGVGMRFLNQMCERELAGDGFVGRPVTTQFHTAHPGLLIALDRDPKWRRISERLTGSMGNRGWGTNHWRSVAGYRYYGERAVK